MVRLADVGVHSGSLFDAGCGTGEQTMPVNWGPRRVTDGELCATFRAGWRISSLTPDRFALNPGSRATIAEAWLADIVRLASG